MYPVCENCGGEINPVRYDDCEKYFISDGRILCKECFIEESIEYIKTNLNEFANIMGVAVCYN